MGTYKIVKTLVKPSLFSFPAKLFFSQNSISESTYQSDLDSSIAKKRKKCTLLLFGKYAQFSPIWACSQKSVTQIYYMLESKKYKFVHSSWQTKIRFPTMHFVYVRLGGYKSDIYKVLERQKKPGRWRSIWRCVSPGLGKLEVVIAKCVCDWKFWQKQS